MTTITYGDAFLNVDDFHERGIKGDGIKVAVIDHTAIYPHEALDIKGGHACGRLINYEGNGTHGTHCAGIIAAKNLDNGKPIGVAPNVDLYFVRMDISTYGSRVNSIVEGVYWCIDNGIDVISISQVISENAYRYSGGSLVGCPKHLRIKLRNAFATAYKKGLAVFVSSGNNNDTAIPYDMENEGLLVKMPGVIVVGNVGRNNKIISSSNPGAYVDLVGYGSRILSTYNNNKYSSLTGTSMSAPQVAGYFCLYKQLYNTLSNKEVLGIFLNNCVSIQGIDRFYQGRGVPSPPTDLYSKPIIEERSIFRMFSYEETWQETEAFYKEGNTWKEMEAIGNVE